MKSIIPDRIEGPLLASKVDLIEDTRVKKTSVSPQNDKELKGTRICDNKHKTNKSGSDGIKTQLPNARSNCTKEMKEPTFRQNKVKSKA